MALDNTFFDQVRDAFEGFASAVPGELHTTAHSRGLKAWYGEATKEHYEAQLIRTANGIELEIGFHAEHSEAARNTEMLDRLLIGEPALCEQLGDGVEAGEFIGRKGWKRVSEVVDVPDEGDVDALIEVAARLADYVIAIEPLRRGSNA